MEWKGSFIGFTFGNRHSSKLGIFRTTENGRYSLNLTPKSKDQVTEIGAVDGIHYYGANYTNREIPISFAFYGLSEEQIQQLKRIFNDKKIHELILDEEPYKVWSAKLTGTAICKHVCFEKDNARFYNGEGTFVFTAYYPFARSRYEYIEDYGVGATREQDKEDLILAGGFDEEIIYPAFLSYGYEQTEKTGTIVAAEEFFKEWLEEMDLLTDSNYNLDDINSSIIFSSKKTPEYLEEWQEASEIPSNTTYGNYNDGKYKLYNAGDIPMPFKIYLPVNELPQTIEIYIEGAMDKNMLKLEGVYSINNDSYILIDGFTHTIRGCDEQYNVTKNLYNNKITQGDFFELPVKEIYLVSPKGKLEYKYLYL